MSRVANDARLSDVSNLVLNAVLPGGTPFESLLSQRINRKGDDAPTYAGAQDAAPPLEEYESIEAPGTTANDTIVYVTKDGERVIVLRSTSPELYVQVEKDYGAMQALDQSASDKAVRVDADATAPAFGKVSDVDLTHRDSGVLTYKVDDKLHVVVESENPTVFGLIEAAGQSAVNGDRIATDNEKWPPALDTQVEAPGTLGAGVIRYEHDGKNVVVESHVNPALFDYLTSVHTLGQSPEGLSALDKLVDDGATLADRNTAAPALADIDAVSKVTDGVYRVELKDGKSIAVSRELTPDLYTDIGNLSQVKDGLAASEKDGYAMADSQLDPDTITVVGPPEEVAPGVIRFEVKDGDSTKKLVVAETIDPKLYEQVKAKWVEFSPGVADGVRGEFDLPKQGELDISTFETTTKDKDGKPLTVSDVTWQKLMEKWKTEIDSGAIGKDDDRFKLYTALRAKAAAEQGIELKSLDISTGLSLTQVLPDDLKDILDSGKLDETIQTLFTSEAVTADFTAQQKLALDALPNKDETLNRIVERATSEDYVKYIQELKARGEDAVAEADIAQTYAAIQMIDPEKAAKFLQDLQVDTTLIDVEAFLADPSKISQENTTVATQDAMKLFLTALKKAGVDLPRRTVESMDKFINEFLNDKQKAGDFGRALQELGDLWNKNGQITQANIDDLLKNGTYKALDELSGGSFASTLAEANKMGVLGSLGGLISLTSGIYQAAGKGGTLADTPEERLSIAKDLIGFFGASQHFTTFGTKMYDQMKGTNINEMLGLDKTLPEIWGNDKLKGKDKIQVSSDGAAIQQRFAEIIAAAPDTSAERLKQTLNINDDQLKLLQKGIEEGFAKNTGLPSGSSTVTKTATSFLKLLNVSADTFGGVADLVLGAFKINKANGDQVKVAEGAITIASGAFGTLGGTASGIQAIGKFGSTIARALAAPLFWVGAALSIIVIGFSIYDDIKRSESINKYQDGVDTLFDDLNSLGLLTDDGVERYEFLKDYLNSYGQRDAPDDQGIFEYRAEEWQFYAEEGHIPEPSFDDVEHKDYDGDGPNLDTLLD